MLDFPPNPDAYPRLRIRWERWWANRTRFRSAPGRGLRAVILLAVLAFVIVVVPFLLPLGGPASVDPAALADPNGAFIEVAGERLYTVHAPGAGETVILLHGFGGSTASWTDTLSTLAAAGYDVYAFDLAGFGLSDKGWERDYSHPAQARRVIGLMDALGIRRAHIVGHSMGGNVAAHLALTFPDRVNKLVLVNAAIQFSGEAAVPDFVLRLPFVRRWGQFGLRRIMVPRADDLLRDAAYRDDAITPELVMAYERALLTPGWDTGVLGLVRDADQNALPAPIGEIGAPTLILVGAQDTWVSPGDGEQVEKLISGSKRIVLPDVGHLPMHEAPEAFNAALISFLKEGIPEESTAGATADPGVSVTTTTRD